MREALHTQAPAYGPESGPESELKSAPESEPTLSARLSRRDSATSKTAKWAVRRLTLTDFRNYSALRLDLDPCPVVLTGANGAGKTNLLEALSYLAPGQGLRGPQ